MLIVYLTNSYNDIVTLHNKNITHKKTYTIVLSYLLKYTTQHKNLLNFNCTHTCLITIPNVYAHTTSLYNSINQARERLYKVIKFDNLTELTVAHNKKKHLKLRYLSWKKLISSLKKKATLISTPSTLDLNRKKTVTATDFASTYTTHYKKMKKSTNEHLEKEFNNWQQKNFSFIRRKKYDSRQIGRLKALTSTLRVLFSHTNYKVQMKKIKAIINTRRHTKRMDVLIKNNWINNSRNTTQIFAPSAHDTICNSYKKRVTRFSEPLEKIDNTRIFDVLCPVLDHKRRSFVKNMSNFNFNYTNMRILNDFSVKFPTRASVKRAYMQAILNNHITNNAVKMHFDPLQYFNGLSSYFNIPTVETRKKHVNFLSQVLTNFDSTTQLRTHYNHNNTTHNMRINNNHLHTTYINAVLLNFFESFFGKKVWVRLNTQSYANHAWKMYFSFWMSNNAQFCKRASKLISVKQILEVLLFTFKCKDLKVFLQLVKDILEQQHFKKHKKILLVIFDIIKKNNLMFVATSLKGFSFDIRGKVGVSGNAKKRHIFFAYGKTTTTTQSVRSSMQQVNIWTPTGQMGLTCTLHF